MLTVQDAFRDYWFSLWGHYTRVFIAGLWLGYLLGQIVKGVWL